MSAVLPEQVLLDELLKYQSPYVTKKILARVPHNNTELPIYGITIGSNKPDRMTLALIGGVHGVERIGTHVVLSFLNKIIQELAWDEHWQNILQKIRIVSIPILNPVGMLSNSRANHRGVDLMRNAPLDAEVFVLPLIGGHRLGPHIAWYRGSNIHNLKSNMEIESKALVGFIEEQIFPAPGAICLDVHSGFGLQDRLWYPFAGLKRVFPEKEKIDKIVTILDRTIPYHIYTIEPQAHHYGAHGDLWDYLYIQHENYCQTHGQARTFIPLTLEIGSWVWAKKNPWQIFGRAGLFNPMKQHRYERTMRRHFLLLEFLIKMVANPQLWGSE